MGVEKQRRPGRWFLGCILGLAGLVVAAVILLRLTAGSRGQNQILALKEAGLPTSSAELDKWYPYPSPSNNAALLIEEAIALHVAPGEFFANNSPPTPGQPLDSEWKEAIAEHLAQNREALEKVYAAASLTESRYSINLNLGANTLLPHLAQIKALTQMLRYESMLNSAKGNPDGAARSIMTSFALARTLRPEPILISELVRIACVAITVDSLERLLSEHALNTNQLAAFSRELEQAEKDGRKSVYRALVGERAGALPYFDSLLSASQLQSNPSSKPPAPIYVIASGTYRLLGFNDRDLRLYLGAMGQFTSAATNDYPEMLRLSDEVEKDILQRTSHGFGRYAVITKIMIPAVSKAFAKEAALATRLRCARIAMGVEEYRQAHSGSLPGNLESLVPQFLPKAIGDPVVGKPFEFQRRKPTGYVITSPSAEKVLKNQRTATFSVLR
jgi:hypothetical protein